MADVDSERSTETGTAAQVPGGPLRGAAAVLAPADGRAADPPARTRPLRTASGDDYVIESEAGRGGVGVVYRARDQRLGRVVAVKELQRDDPTARLRFEREMRITARLQHPGVVPVHEAGRWPTGEPFYAMKLVEGDSLKACIADARGLAARLALLPSLIAVADTMAYAHAHRVTHRDLKPANVIIGAFGETVVIDWGLAKELDEPADAADALADTLVADPYRQPLDLGTRAGTVVGTPAYMPPEQAQGQVVDQRADVYALGAMLYHLLTGVPPYAGASSGEVLSQVLAGSPPPVDGLVAGAPRELCAITRRAMAREVDDRYPSASELADELRRFQAGQLVGAYRYSRRELAGRWLRRHRGVALTVAIATLLIAGGGVTAIARILAERTRADHERDQAIQQRELATRAERTAERTANQVILAHASGDATHDPTLALAWLERLAPGEPAERERAREIALAALGHPFATAMWKAWQLPPYQLVFAPDGRSLLAASASEAVVVLDVATGAVRARWPMSTQPLAESASLDHRRVAFLDRADSVAVAEPGAARLDHPAGCEGHVASVVLSPDGRWLACFRPDASTRVIDLDGGARVDWPAAAGWPSTTQLVWAADGTELYAVTGTEAALQVLTLEGGHTRRLAPAGLHAPVRRIAAAGGTRLFVTGGDGSLALVDARDGRITWRGDAAAGDDTEVEIDASASAGVVAYRRAGESVHVLDVAAGAEVALPASCRGRRPPVVAPSGRYVAVPCDDARVLLWDRRSSAAWTLAGQGGEYALAWAPGEDVLATSGSEGRVRLWPVPAGAPRLARHADASFHALAVGPWVVTDSRAGTVIAVDATTLATRTFTLGHDMIYALAGDAAGRQVAAGSMDGRISILRTDAPDGPARVLGAGTQPIWALAFDATGERLAAARTDGAELWRLADGTRVALAGHHGEVRAVALGQLSGEALVLTGGEDATVRLFAVDGTPRRVFSGHTGAVQQVRFAGEAVVSGSMDGSVRLWQPYRGEGTVIAQHTGYVRALLVSPSLRYVASGGDDGTVAIYDLSGHRSLRLAGLEGGVRALVFAADEHALYAASTGGTLWRWDFERDQVCALRAPDGAGFSGIALAQGGAALVSAALDGELRLHATTPVACLSTDAASWPGALAALTRVQAPLGQE
jgi:WD40 repeat protein/tRNA A-37 threonylcarbamoyl transferase component Bud32